MLFFSRVAARVALLFPLSLSAFTPPGDGLYAVFETSLGEFAAELYYEDVGYTVANFVGLAEGSRPWLDVETGVVRTDPYYDGIIFHRVIAGFMNQAGSPNGQGTDGPGYTIWDEIRVNRTHNKTGILSMAKTSAPNSGGSQFFVTTSTPTHLDGNHSVFGEVVEGMDIVTAINQTPTGANDRPITPVVIERLRIVRQGAAAEAFDVDDFLLPQLSAIPVEFDAAQTRLIFEREAAQTISFYTSTDLLSWTPAHQVAQGTLGPQVWEIGDRLTGSSLFISPSSLREPAFTDRRGRTLNLDLGGGTTIVVRFDDTSPSRGTFALTQNGQVTSGNLDSYQWRELASGAQVFIDYDTVIPMQVHLQTKGNSGAAQLRLLFSVNGSQDSNASATFLLE